MSESYFDVSLGLAISNNDSAEPVQVIFPIAGVPGSAETTLSNAAPLGAFALDTLTGRWHRKHTAGSGASVWELVPNQNEIGAGANISWREPVLVKDSTAYASLAAAETAVNTGTIDGVTVSEGDRILFDNISGSNKNVYIVTGTPGAGATLTEDTNTATEGDTLYVQDGTSAGQQWTYNGTAWVLSNQSSVDELGFIRAFIGKDAAGSETPSYSSTNYATGSLETAIGAIDAQVGTNTTNIGTNTTSISNLQTEVDNIETAMGAAINNDGTFNTTALDSGDYMDAATDITEALLALDAAIAGIDLSGLQTEIDNIETAVGYLNTDGTFNTTALDSGNYMDAVTTGAGALLALDAQIFTNTGNIGTNTTAISNVQTEVDNIETAMGTMINTDGTFNDTALDGGDYMDAATDVTGALLALDAAIGNITNDDSFQNLFMGKTALGSELPAYAHENFVADNDSLVAAIDKLDLWLERAYGRNTGSATSVTDSVLVDDVKAVRWLVHIQQGTNVYTYEVDATHNGTAGGDATVVDNTKYARLKIGNIAGLSVDVTLTGATTTQAMNLIVSATASVDVTSVRLSVV